MNCAKIQKKLDETSSLKDFEQELAVEEKNHLNECAHCQDSMARYREADNIVSNMQKIEPPVNISQNYMAGLFQKLENDERPDKTVKIVKPRVQWAFVRTALAGVAGVLIIFGVWRFGFHSGSTIPSEYPTSDSLEYYVESFNEVSSLNPVYVVKEIEYDLSDYERSDAEDQ